MKKQYSIILLSGILLFFCSRSALAQLSGTGVLTAPNYDSFVPPATGTSYTDPVFGSTIKRISNAPFTSNSDRGGMLTWIENEYSTMSAFNNDNSKLILVHESYFGLYNGDGVYVRDLPLEINSSSEPRWSRKDNETLYYHTANQFKSYNIATGVANVVHAFSEYSSISGNGEMDISFDGDHFVFAGDGRYIFVYQISTDTKFRVFDTTGAAFDATYITPDNNVTITWKQSGTARFSGIELFDTNMNFLRQVAHVGGHMDVTRDTNGDEVLVWTNSNDSQPIPNCNNGIVKIRLADGTQTCLAKLDWSLAVHISAPDGNGTVFVETYAPANPSPDTSAWVPYTNELLQIKLDASRITRLAHHRSRPWNSYNYEPKMSTSRDGSRVLFASNYDLQKIDGYTAEYSDTYLMVLGATSSTSSGSPPLNPPSAVTGTTTRLEQDNSAVQYSGAWYPNHGAFNSGGSASLAMNSGDSVKLTFNGTGVKWIGYSDPWSGIAEVYVDSALKATVDTYSANALAQKAQYSVAGLSNGTHMLNIVVNGRHNAQSHGAWVWMDAFDVTTGPLTPAPPPPPPSSAPVRIEHNNAAIVYTGSWASNSTAPSSAGAVLCMDANARATLSFTGSGVTWIGYRDQWSGIANVYVDGVLKNTVDTYLSPAAGKTPLYTVTGMTSGPHTLAIEVTGTHSFKSGGSWIWVDAFDVTP